MKQTLVLLTLLSLAAIAPDAHAAKIAVTWVNPTQNTGGTVLIARRGVVVTYGIVLVNVGSFEAGPWILNVPRPLSFDPGTGASTNFGYGG